jgi:hypothetical protein
MPLKCLHHQNPIFAFDYDEAGWDQLKASHRAEPCLTMACCGAKAILKVSKLGTRFFAHHAIVYCSSNGSIKPRFVRIDSQTDQLAQNFDSIQAMNFCIQNDTAYLYNYDNTKGTYWIKTFDCKKEQIISQQFIADATSMKLPFGIYVHPDNGNVYIADAKDYVSKGDLYCFSRNGKLKYKIAGVGLNPNTIIVR